MEVKKNYSSSNVRGLAQKVTQSLTSCAQPAIKKRGFGLCGYFNSMMGDTFL